MINYCNEAQVASALAMNPTSTLSGTSVIPAGAQTLTVNGGTWYPGQRIAIDHYQDDTVGEVVLIQSVSGNTLTLNGVTAKDHYGGAPVVEVTAITKTIASASRMIDDITYYTDTGFNQETRTETRIGYLQNDGSIAVSVKKPIIQSISNMTIQNTPLDPVISVPVNQWAIDGYNITAYLQNTSYVPPSGSSRKVQVTLTYVGGYTVLPDAIVRSAIVFAARFFKEKDSGFADVIGNTDLGVMQYKKGVPAEILVLLKPYIRVTP